MATLAFLLLLAGPMTPHQPKTFAPGCPLIPADKLEAWLDRQQGTLRLPVTLTADPLGQVTRAMVGALEVKLRDAALGVSLADRVRQYCPRSGACALRLEGRWAGQRRFDLSWVAGAVKPGEPVDQAEVEVR